MYNVCTFIDILSGRFTAFDHNYGLFVTHTHTHTNTTDTYFYPIPRRVVLQPPLAVHTHLCVINVNGVFAICVCWLLVMISWLMVVANFCRRGLFVFLTTSLCQPRIYFASVCMYDWRGSAIVCVVRLCCWVWLHPHPHYISGAQNYFI